MRRIRTLETSTHTGVNLTAISITLVLTELTAIRTETRQDLAALSDELAGLRRHLHEHLTALRAELLHQPSALPQPEDHPETPNPNHH
ncbi:hypothetical protein AB0I81_15735 [Nonomuraea sp. NPDC050404]|uniref:hypothetical protein n=1 Tax=Nonomuraea sp. NPDC050404 TaxID=3155783 RepID=UPI0034026EBB